MSSDDRSPNQPPAPDDQGRAADRPPLRGDGMRAPAPRSRWQVDPDEVDRYLAERARAASAYPPRSGNPPAAPSPSVRQPPPPEAASPRPAVRSSAAGSGVGGRTRRPASTPRRSEPTPGHDPFAADEWSDILDDSWQEPESAGPPVAASTVTAPGQRRGRQSARARTQARGVLTHTARTARPLPKLVLPATIRRADFVHDRTALLFFGLSAASAAAMAIVMATRIGGLDAFIPVHLDAAGQPDRWGPRRSLWAIPLLAAMVPLVNAALGSIGSGIDHFARRFLLATALLVQLLAWVAVIRLL